ncbi:MAG: hypothetical protein IT290_13220 [Deltaproteobacteria bacterium]|nr:hypothetical protein [Deltaproteobacteria bacterium]
MDSDLGDMPTRLTRPKTPMLDETICGATVLSFARTILLAAALLAASGCAYLPQNLAYEGPQPRPESLESYYQTDGAYTSFTEELVESSEGIDYRLIEIESTYGPVMLDYYSSGTPNPNLVIVFPILGGNYYIEKHFARYFAEHGLDSLIIRRNSEFKDPERLFEIEEVLRQGVVRDRITLDFLRDALGKTELASFGISRGAINASILAGIDPRLKYNVLVLGGSNLAKLMEKSDQPGLKRYRERAGAKNNISEAELLKYIAETVRTDPAKVAPHIDSRNTLMVLAALDTTVPFRYGMQLRRQIGQPETIFLLADHYTSLLFTQLAHLFLPSREICFFPMDYVETEALGFYRKSFGLGGGGVKKLSFSTVKVPFGVFESIRCMSRSECRHKMLAEQAKTERQYRVRSLPIALSRPTSQGRDQAIVTE